MWNKYIPNCYHWLPQTNGIRVMGKIINFMFVQMSVLSDLHNATVNFVMQKSYKTKHLKNRIPEFTSDF